MGERNSTAGQREQTKHPKSTLCHSLPCAPTRSFSSLLSRYQSPSYSFKSGFLIGLRICKDLLIKMGPGFLDFGKLKERQSNGKSKHVVAKTLFFECLHVQQTTHESRLFIYFLFFYKNLTLIIILLDYYYYFFLSSKMKEMLLKRGRGLELGDLIESITILASPSMIIDLRQR